MFIEQIIALELRVPEYPGGTRHSKAGYFHNKQKSPGK